MLAGQFVAGLSDYKMRHEVSLERSLIEFMDVVSFARHIEQHQKDMQVFRSAQGGAPNAKASYAKQQNNNNKTAPEKDEKAQPQSQADQQEASLTCWHCGEAGHLSSACPAKERGEARPKENQAQNRRKANATRQRDVESSRSEAQQAVNLFRDYVERDPTIVAGYTSKGARFRSMSNEVTAGRTLFGPSPEVTFEVYGVHTRGPIDSGSQNSIVSYELLRKLYERNSIDINKDCVDCPPGLDVRSVTNQQLPILGMLMLQVTAPTGKTIRAPFLVQKFGLGHDILIGTNYMSRLGYSLTAEGLGDVISKEAVSPMRHSEPEANTPPMKVHLVQRVQILSRCDQLIKLRTECSMQSMKEGPILFEPFSERSFKGLQMQPALVQPDEKGHFALWVRNLSTRRLDLEDDSLLGTIEAVNHPQSAEKENRERAPSERTATVQLAASRGSSPALERGGHLDCISWEKCALAPSKIQELRALIVEFENAFAIDDNELGQTHMAVHTIDMGSAKPIKQPLRSCPFALRETVHKLTQQYLRQGVISPSKSPWSSPLVMVKKKEQESQPPTRGRFGLRAHPKRRKTPPGFRRG
uniref:CCHC-type domain-containing protein n=1 Tax=Plectus sambesii TaxID=2011161 RepID=A0A914VFU8_9BILA